LGKKHRGILGFITDRDGFHPDSKKKTGADHFPLRAFNEGKKMEKKAWGRSGQKD